LLELPFPFFSAPLLLAPRPLVLLVLGCREEIIG
jgi:hypothetical protein